MIGLSRRTLLLALGGLAWRAYAQSTVPAEVGSELPAARLQGQGRLSFFGLHIYDARLWVTQDFKPEAYAQTPLALELAYARDLNGRQIAERSLAEMKKVSDVSAAQGERWLAEMVKTFPDVKKGDRITGVHRPTVGMRFFINGQLHGDITDTDFASRFIGIWLSPRSSEPKLRQALLGITP